MTNPGTNLSRVAIVIPALDEAHNLPVLLPELRRLQPGQIIVADNGSTDSTAHIARAQGANVASAPMRGYGNACQAGLKLLYDEIDIIVFTAADLCDDHMLVPALVAPIQRDEADLVIGTRVSAFCDVGAMTAAQRFGDALAVSLIKFGWGARFYDLGPFRAIRRSGLKRLNMRDHAFGWTVEMQIRAVEEGLGILELPVPYAKGRGKSKIGGSIRGIYRASRSILSTISRLWVTRTSRRSTV